MGHSICRRGDERSIRRYFEPRLAERKPDPPSPAADDTDWMAGLLGKGRRLTKAAAKWIAAGRPVVTEEQYAERLGVCQGNADHPRCPVYDALRGKCGDCGCGLKKGIGPIPAKTRMATEDCPRGKWPKAWPRKKEEPIVVEPGLTPLPPSMKAPGDHRPTWRGGIIQVMVTRACDLACHHCTQASNLAGKPVVMTPEEYDAALASLKGYPGVVGMFGGNPAMHPRFEELCRILKSHFPWEQRGIWCNHPRGKAAVMRGTFNPAHSNLNCHMSTEAYDQFARDWPESIPHLKGMDRDSVHGPPFVAMKDVEPDESKRWEMIAACDVNQFWSALVGVVPGRGLRAYFCEIAYTQAAMHATADDAADWPDTGLPAEPGWWRKPMAEFDAQVRLHCHSCGIPLRREGQLALGGEHEEYSATHAAIMRPKVKDRPVELVSLGGMIERPGRPATQYLPGTTPGYRGT